VAGPTHLLATASPAVAAVCVAGAYLLGTFPSARLAARHRGVDPTAAGSGNPGATNVYRTAGRRAGALTLVGDLAKGAVAAGVGWVVGGHGLGVACGVAAVIGHVAPLTRRLQGGKGVATGAGMALVLFPLAALLSAAAFAVVTGLSRRVSLGSMAAVAALPAAAGALGAPGREVAALAASAVLVIARHGANIGRLWRGEEPRFGTAA
jgi:glycerol-3-phosphate acyltransferase PlsY